MKSHVTKDFRELFAALPERAQQQAEDAYELFRRDPYHASLHFKRVRGTTGYYSARVGMHYRVVGDEDGDDIIWFWIGSHVDYDALIAQF